MTVSPIAIRPHLVPFFFKESEGKDFIYLNNRVKTAVFTNCSSVGKIIRLLMVKAGAPVTNVKRFNLYLTISESTKKAEGTIYKYENGKNSFLVLPPEVNNDINDFLEDTFRMAFVSYVNGAIKNNPNSNVVAVIDNFIDEYEFLEMGYNNEMLRRLYYREKNKVISRFQKNKSSSVLNCS